MGDCQDARFFQVATYRAAAISANHCWFPTADGLNVPPNHGPFVLYHGPLKVNPVDAATIAEPTYQIGCPLGLYTNSVANSVSS